MKKSELKIKLYMPFHFVYKMKILDFFLLEIFRDGGGRKKQHKGPRIKFSGFVLFYF